MEELLGAMAITFIFGGGAAFLLAVSPIGRAIADRIRRRGLGDDQVQLLHDHVDGLLSEMETMRAEMTDLQERLDFTERLLARDREPGRLGPSSDV